MLGQPNVFVNNFRSSNILGVSSSGGAETEWSACAMGKLTPFGIRNTYFNSLFVIHA